MKVSPLHTRVKPTAKFVRILCNSTDKAKLVVIFSFTYNTPIYGNFSVISLQKHKKQGIHLMLNKNIIEGAAPAVLTQPVLQRFKNQ